VLLFLFVASPGLERLPPSFVHERICRETIPMRREGEWLIMGLTLVLFAFTTQANHQPSNGAPVVIDLRRPSYSVVLRIDQAPMVMSSLPAADERSLFGIVAKPSVAVALSEAPAAVPPAVSEAPRKRFAALRTVRRKAAFQRALPGASVAETVEVPVVPEKADLAVMELAAPPRRSSTAIAATDSAAATERPALGFSLSDRTSLKVGPLSSMVPSYSADTAHGDFQERWRLNDERDASQGAGAAVGMTFKLN
jgi:hypothetical protein